MKRRIIIAGALVLLLTVVVFMGWDLFFSPTNDNINPYVYDLASLKSGDTSLIRYKEAMRIIPGLSEIHGIATDRSDQIYVAGKNGVEIFDQTGKRVGAFSFDETARCIQVDFKGIIYLGMQDHLEIYSSSGKLLKKWKSCSDKAIITSVAINGNDVFIADAGNKIVYHYNTDGKLLKHIGQKDPEKGIPGFIVPSPWFDLAIGRNGELWVVNPGRHSFEQYSIEGELIKSWGKASMTLEGFCGCCNPSHFAILSDGSFVTSEKGIERVKIYKSNGDFSCVVVSSKSFIEGTQGLDIAVDSKERIIVLDPVKNQIRIFTEKFKN
ncbi:MAG: hypothetical protein WCK84_06515 [Bacteroidota bacterium]